MSPLLAQATLHALLFLNRIEGNLDRRGACQPTHDVAMIPPEIIEQIAAANLDAKLYTPTGATEFRQFIDEVLTNPKAYPGYEPIDLSGEPD